ncbi:MAG: hypothetical protein ACRD5H_10255 [Nitrososphaerales archaeon]
MAKKYIQPGALPMEVIEDYQAVFAVRNVTQATTIGAALTPLHSIPLIPNALDRNGKVVIIETQFLFLGAISTKRIVLALGAATFLDVAGIASNNVGGYLRMFLQRISNSRYTVSVTLFPQCGYGGGGFSQVYQGQNEVADVDFGLEQVFAFSGQCANAADTILQFGTILTVT